MCRARICAGTYAHMPQGCITWSSLTGTGYLYSQRTIHGTPGSHRTACVVPRERERERESERAREREGREEGFFIKARQSDQNMSLYQPRPFCPLYPSNGAPWSCPTCREKTDSLGMPATCTLLFPGAASLPRPPGVKLSELYLRCTQMTNFLKIVDVRSVSMRFLDLRESVCTREEIWGFCGRVIGHADRRTYSNNQRVRLVEAR